MGQTSSTTSIADRNTFRRRLSFRSSIRRRRMPRLMKSRSQAGNGRSDLSEAFNMISDDFQVDLLNINEATEEQLMTLPGIGRRTAQGIVDYRRAIGQFRKVEDLAIVSGVGAAKLSIIRSEISVTSRRQRTKASAGLVRSASCGIPSTLDPIGILGEPEMEPMSSSTLNPNVSPVDLNAASMFQLMSIRGISQEMAANIVHYREKKGRFRTVEDLAKVRGFSGRILGEYKSYLTVVSDDSTLAFTVDGRSSAKNGCLPRRMTHRRSISVPVSQHLITTNVDVQIKDIGSATDDHDTPTSIEIYEALADMCFRPPVIDRFAFTRNDKPALRLATWNLDRFDDDKSSNLGVIEVICLTILESGVSLVALQELASRQVLEKICYELNNPTLKKVRDWIGHRGTWECLTTSDTHMANGSGNESKDTTDQHLAFLFDASRGIEVIKSETIDRASLRKNNDSGAAAAAFSVTFKMDTFVICLLCVRLTRLLNESQTKDDTMVAVFNAWQQKVKGASLLLVLGDFKYDSLSKELKILKDHHFTNLVPSHKDNIWINPSVKNHFTGYSKVIRNGLSHLAIPKGKWNLGGNASSHCPVWAEFYVPSAANPEAAKSNGSVPTNNGNVINSPLKII